MIYLDYAATTPLDPAVLEAMLPHLREGGSFANPASTHGPGYKARAAVEKARAQVAALLGAEAAEIVWTSGATESNNLAIKGALEFHGNGGRGVRNAHIDFREPPGSSSSSPLAPSWRQTFEGSDRRNSSYLGLSFTGSSPVAPTKKAKSQQAVMEAKPLARF